ncbi:hypothetical protein HMI54_002238 [Coelomomyces lativittatus]|nr:hypothetical protein HMI56_003973 [Coelomomyces lativittatus]KAJ1501580.1 hypothetical protein HMI55_003320 [Coelomomyces lativittatus]KAJ1509631.1 hypothetical protein HMI54_002238 [Coelomomyces lativittatus]
MTSSMASLSIQSQSNQPLKKKKKKGSSRLATLHQEDDTPSKFKWIMKYKASLTSKPTLPHRVKSLTSHSTSPSSTSLSSFSHPRISTTSPTKNTTKSSLSTTRHTKTTPPLHLKEKKSSLQINRYEKKIEKEPPKNTKKKKKKPNKSNSLNHTLSRKENPKSDLKLDTFIFGEVVQAPPTLSISKKMQTLLKNPKLPSTSLGFTAKERLLKVERATVIERYRELKRKRELERKQWIQQKESKRVDWKE